MAIGKDRLNRNRGGTGKPGPPHRRENEMTRMRKHPISESFSDKEAVQLYLSLGHPGMVPMEEVEDMRQSCTKEEWDEIVFLSRNLQTN
jgi:hypothetical protein